MRLGKDGLTFKAVSRLTRLGCQLIVHGTPEVPKARAISLIWEIPIYTR